MPRHNWPTDPTQLVQQFEQRHANPDAGALLLWGTYCVDCLHYLDDIDCEYDNTNTVIGGHNPDIVDVAHARWASGTSVTALDVCAAGLGRTFCGHTATRELAVTDFDPGNQRNRVRANRLRALLPPAACQWIVAVISDQRYHTLKQARNWLTHSRMRRHFVLNTNGPPVRLQLDIGNARVSARDIVQISRDLATDHVTALLNLLPTL